MCVNIHAWKMWETDRLSSISSTLGGGIIKADQNSLNLWWLFSIATYSTTVDVIQINMLGIRHKIFLGKHLTTERSSLRYGLNSDWSRYIWILVLGQTEYCSSELQYLWADWWLVHRFLVIYWFSARLHTSELQYAQARWWFCEHVCGCASILHCWGEVVFR